RTPLTSILGYTRMLKTWGLDNPDAAREGLGALEDEAERMHRLVESLLQVARGDELPALHREDQDLVPILRESVETARAFVGDEPGSVGNLPATPVYGRVDRAALMQAIEILVDNAVKYARSSTPIRVWL